MHLEWSDHGTDLSSSLFDLLSSSPSLSDVTLSAEGRHIRAHRAVLAAASKHLRVS